VLACSCVCIANVNHMLLPWM